MVQIREPAFGFKFPPELPPYWAPLRQASLKHGVPLILVPPHGGATPKISAAWICVIGDDRPGHFGSPGPDAFHPSVRRLFRRAALVIVLAAEAVLEYYAAVASVAVLERKKAILIETRPEHAEAWQQLATDEGVMRLVVVNSDLPRGTRVFLPLDATKQ